MKKIKLNNKGFGKKETMFCLLIIIAGVAIVATNFLKNADSNHFQSFIRLSKEFADAAGVTRDGETIAAFESRVFLYDVMSYNYMDWIESPFDESDYCDVYESQIEMEKESVYITFRCSEYLIYKQITTNEDFKIYKVSDWTEEPISGSNVQKTKFYNYKVNGVEQLPEYLQEKEFIVKYNEAASANIYFITNLKAGHELVEKTYYRTMERVNF